MSAIVEQSFWNGFWQGKQLDYDERSILFTDLFDRFLPKTGTCFEVGCFPGNFLVYLARRFGYRVSGIDYVPDAREHMRAYLERLGCQVDDLFFEDFLRFTPTGRYDVVCSFGFVEHFENLKAVLAKHVELVAPGGTLVVSCPNFRYVQYMLHWMLDRTNLRRHVIPVMNLRRWTSILRSQGMEILHAGYYRTFDFWYDQPVSRLQARIGSRVHRVAQKLDRWVHLPNRFTSPYMIAIARKRQ